MKRHIHEKVLAAFLALVMVFSLLPMQTLAAENTAEPTTPPTASESAAAAALTAPSFAAAQEGYDQPAAQVLTITNGTADAVTVQSVTVDNSDAFTVTNSGAGHETIAPGGTLDTYAIQPKAGLAAGDYTATVTAGFAEEGAAAAAAQVNFTVNAAETPAQPEEAPQSAETAPLLTASAPESYLYDVSEGNITIAAGTNTGTLKVTYGAAQTVADNIAGTQSITLTGTTAANTVTVSGSVSVSLVLSSLNIDVSGTAEACALNLNEAGACTVTLSGSSTLKSGSNRPGLYVPNDHLLTIGGSGSLSITGGDSWPGIGREGGTGRLEM